jgi:hypothetical protein
MVAPPAFFAFVTAEVINRASAKLKTIRLLFNNGDFASASRHKYRRRYFRLVAILEAGQSNRAGSLPFEKV